MRKIIFWVLIYFFNLVSYGMILDDILESVISRKQGESINLSENGNVNKKSKAMSLNVQGNKSFGDAFSSDEGIFSGNSIDSYHEISLTASYKDVYLNNNIQIGGDKISVENLKIGYKKDLKKVFANSEEKEKSIKNIEIEIEQNILELDLNSTVKKTIELFCDIKKNINILERKRNYLAILNEKMRIMQNKIAYEESYDFELEKLKYEYNEKETDLLFAENSINYLIEEFYILTGVKFSEKIKFVDSEIDFLLCKNLELQIKEKELEKLELEYLKIKKEGLTNIIMDTSYDLSNKNLNYDINFNFFNKEPSEIEKKSNKIFKLKNTINEMENLNKIYMSKLKAYYKNLENKFSIKEEKIKKLNTKNKEIEKLYNEGFLETAEYLEYKDEYLQNNQELEDIKTDINEFRYKIKFIGDYDI